MSRAEIIQNYIDDLNAIADLCENAPKRDERLAAECFDIIYVICEGRIKELNELKVKELV